ALASGISADQADVLNREAIAGIVRRPVDRAGAGSVVSLDSDSVGTRGPTQFGRRAVALLAVRAIPDHSKSMGYVERSRAKIVMARRQIEVGRSLIIGAIVRRDLLQERDRC